MPFTLNTKSEDSITITDREENTGNYIRLNCRTYTEGKEKAVKFFFHAAMPLGYMDVNVEDLRALIEFIGPRFDDSE